MTALFKEFEKLRFFVIDDDPITVDLLKDGIGARGHVVEVETDPEKALYKLSHENYDIVISDVHMPKLNGTELVNASIFTKAEWPTTVFISGMMSGKVSKILRERKYTSFVEKPFNFNSLIDFAISSVLQRRSQ